MSTPRQTLTVQLAHAKIRIAELETLLGQSDLNCRDLTRELAAAQMPKAIVVTPARAAYLAKPRAEWVRPAHMEAARQAAMSSGRTTLVAA